MIIIIKSEPPMRETLYKNIIFLLNYKKGYGFITFLAHLAKGNVSFCHHLASVVICRKLSHFNLLLRNHWANCNQTLVEWSLDGPLTNCVQ